MSEVLRVTWTIVPRRSPQPWLHCSRCGGTRGFSSSDRIRVNANGKRVDAWLIYRCTSCDGTWNRPILERQPVRSIDPAYLAGLCRNDPTLAHRLAFDSGGLRRWAERLLEFPEVVVLKQPALAQTAPARRLAILCVVPHPVALRLDRMLAAELQWPRNRISGLAKVGTITVSPGGPRALRKPVRDSTCLTIDLADEDAGRTVAVAVSNASE